jgi:uncharacterized protein (DUF1684 family)
MTSARDGRLHTRLTRWSLAAVLAAAAACTSGPPPPTSSGDFASDIVAFRRSKDEVFRTDPENSPILPSERAAFPGLRYYAPDKSYQVPAALTEDRSDTARTIVVPTSQNKPRRMVRVGRLSFTLAGQQLALGAFVEEGQSLARLWVPFWDLTNRIETYGGGRYLELDRTPTGLYDLDFNRAYNPFCVYNVSYDCPIPPAENRLPLAIRAGERAWP